MSQKGYLIGPTLVTKIRDTINRVEGMPQGSGGTLIPTRFESAPAYTPSQFRVCTITSAWAIGATAAVAFRGVTTTPNTVMATNLIVSLPPRRVPSATRVVNIARDGTAWYLVSFEMATTAAVMSRGTQTLSFVGTAGSQAVTIVNATAQQTLITDISATLNTANCAITISKTTTTVTVISSVRTAALYATPQTMTIAADTYTATIVTLEL